MKDRQTIFDEYMPKAYIIVEKLSKSVLDMLNQVRLDPVNDRFGLMVASFAYKQLEHLKSVTMLGKAGQYRDATAISRIMMEGVIVLKWAGEEPAERSLDWISYSAVENYRLFYGTPAYEKQKTQIESNLKRYGIKFLKKDSQKKPIDKTTPEDYIKSWRENKKPITALFNETKHIELFKSVYVPVSGWVHWDSLSLQQAISVNDEGDIIYGIETKHLGVAALALGIDSLNETARLLDSHFALGCITRLIELSKGHRALLEESLAGIIE